LIFVGLIGQLLGMKAGMSQLCRMPLESAKQAVAASSSQTASAKSPRNGPMPAIENPIILGHCPLLLKGGFGGGRHVLVVVGVAQDYHRDKHGREQQDDAQKQQDKGEDDALCVDKACPMRLLRRHGRSTPDA
jgi:hypothetical protein